ncbi:hypothetical protein [Terasakiella sp. SH-1]|uniref:hypothetical protein n=1 Tax=Terasakiella sp. SH-1 TaxID=2560057 RepID=UPI001074094A|nr:hypothetical protein [Terasakiella sp. SH-1]
MPVLNYHPKDIKFDTSGVENFFLPVSNQETDVFVKTFCKQACAILRTYNIEQNRQAEIAWLCLIYLGLEAVQFFIFARIKESCLEKGIQPRFDQENSILENLLHNNIASSNFDAAFHKILDKNSRGLMWLRWLASPLKKDKFSRRPSKIISRKKQILCFSSEKWIQDLADYKEENLVLSHYQQWFDLKKSSPINFANNDIANELVDLVLSLFSQNNLADIKLYRKSILQSFIQLLDTTNLLLVTAEKSQKNLPYRFWAPSMGNIANRILAHIIYKNGGENTAHDHGTGCGWMDCPEFALTEWSYCQKFIAYSDAHLQSIQKQIIPDYKLTDNSIKLEKTPVPLYDVPRKWDRKSGKHLKIIYVPSHYMIERYYFPALQFDIAQIDFQTKLLMYLSSKGYEVVVKPHPGCKAGFPQQLLKMAGIKADNRPFEEAYNDADIMLMDYPQSTTFRTGLLSQMPIVIFDPGRTPFMNDALPSLEKRVVRLPLVYSDDNQIELDGEELEEAFVKALQLRDSSFQELYYPS